MRLRSVVPVINMFLSPGFGTLITIVLGVITDILGFSVYQSRLSGGYFRNTRFQSVFGSENL